MPFRTISVALTGSNADLSSALRAAGRDIDRFESQTRTSSTRVSQSTGTMTRSFQGLDSVIGRGLTRSMTGFVVAATGAYAAGRALNAALQDVIGGAVQFDARMRNVNSISGLSEAQLGALGDQVLALSRTLPQSANNLAEGLYDIASSGFQGAAGVQVLTAAARAATAGLTDTATSAAAIAGVLNAYGLGAANAKSVSDSLFQTVNLGVLSFGDLAQGIGQVVGTAAAAGVQIDDLGAAIATMTKAGIVPAEAFTSANQLLAQIIQPSEALAGVFKTLGYESGAAALNAKGLSGVMADILQTTGGNITTLSTLFTDIRSLRGALALTTNQGRLYRDVLNDWDAAHKGAGATATALAEQMKSVSAQWELFKNRVHAAAIETGTQLLPTILDLLAGVQSLASGGFDDLGDAIERLAPFFRGIRDIGGDLIRIFGDLVSATEPLARVLIGLAGGAVIGTLNTLAQALAALFNFVDHNRTTFEVLAGVILTLLIPSFVSLGATMSRLIGLGVLNLFLGIGRAAGGARAAVTALTGAMTALATAEGIATIGLTALVAAGAIGMYRLQTATQNAREEIEGITQGFDPTRYKAANARIAELTTYIDKARDRFNELHRVARGASTFGLGPGTDDLKRIREAERVRDQLQTAQLNTLTNANRIGQQLGLAGSEVEAFAEKNNIDLSASWDKAGDAISQVREGLHELANDAGTSLPALQDAADNDIAAMQALAEAVTRARDAAAQAFAGATDVTSLFDPTAAADSVKQAQDTLISAEQNLTDLRARQADKDKLTISDTQQLAKARQDVADATTNLTTAQQAANATGSLSGAYKSAIESGEAFVRNLNDVLERGLDPQLVERLLEEGPAKAAPVLQELVSDHSGRLIKMANESEATLRRINARVVELTRLTTLAVQSTSDKLARDLPDAVRVEQALRESGKKDLEALTSSLHLSAAELHRIATEFGITLPRAVQRELNAHPVHVRVGTRRVPLHDEHQVGGFATGGLFRGRGTGTSDSNLALLSDYEFIVNARDTKNNLALLQAINAGVDVRNQITRYATGGLVGARSGGSVIVQPVIVRESVSHVTQIDRASFDDTRAFDQFQRRQLARRLVRR